MASLGRPRSGRGHVDAVPGVGRSQTATGSTSPGPETWDATHPRVGHVMLVRGQRCCASWNVDSSMSSLHELNATPVQVGRSCWTKQRCRPRQPRKFDLVVCIKKRKADVPKLPALNANKLPPDARLESLVNHHITNCADSWGGVEFSIMNRHEKTFRHSIISTKENGFTMNH